MQCRATRISNQGNKIVSELRCVVIHVLCCHSEIKINNKDILNFIFLDSKLRKIKVLVNEVFSNSL